MAHPAQFPTSSSSPRRHLITRLILLPTPPPVHPPPYAVTFDADAAAGRRLHNMEMSLTADYFSPTKAGTTISDEKIITEGGATIAHDCRSDEGIADPFVIDGFGNLTTWRLSDLKKAFIKNIEDKINEPKTTEKKQTKLERLEWHNDRMELYMRTSLKKYNMEEKLDEDLCFKFVKGLKETLIVEGCYKMYRHFNFEAMQADTSISLFFAEVILGGEECEVSCCKLLGDDDNGRCFGCSNQGHGDLRHPTSDNAYLGGHVDCMFPFLIDTDSEDDID